MWPRIWVTTTRYHYVVGGREEKGAKMIINGTEKNKVKYDHNSPFFLFASSLLSLVAGSVILLFRLGATPSPALCVLSPFLRSCCLFILFFFSSFPFSILIWTSRWFVPSCVFLVWMSWYAYLTVFFYFSLRYTICFSYYCIISCFIRFPPDVLFRSRVSRYLVLV